MAQRGWWRLKLSPQSKHCPRALSFTPRLAACMLCADIIAARGADKVTAEEVVRAVRPEGRAAVPDSIKAELLSRIKAFVLSL